MVTRLVLDLSKVDFMDSAGLGLILGRLRHVSAGGGKLILLDPGADIMRILRLAGIDKRLAIVEGGSGADPSCRAAYSLGKITR